MSERYLERKDTQFNVAATTTVVTIDDITGKLVPLETIINLEEEGDQFNFVYRRKLRKEQQIGSSIFYILLPMETANPIIPNYSDGVKITDWDVRLQAYPYDYCTTKGAHYRTFGADQKFHFTKTTTHEALEQGITPKNKKGDDDTTRVTRRPMINFTSFPVIDTEKRFAATMKEATDCSPYRSDNKAKMYMTTYKRSYIDHRPRPIKEPEVIPDIQDVYPLFNRISKSDFEVIGPMAPRKFMDDHLMLPSPQKQLSNHYKQIRMVSYCPWLGTYK